MFCCGISLSTISAVIGFTSLLFNKTVDGFNSIIEKELLFLLPLNLLNYIKLFSGYHYLNAGLLFSYSSCIFSLTLSFLSEIDST